LYPELLSVSQTAEELGRSTDFVRDEISRKHLAHHRMGGRIFVSRDDLIDYVKRCRVAAFGERPRKKPDCTAVR
jgi:excisionase family DNA binding protein